MLEFVTSSDIVAEIKLIRSAGPRSILLVEGDTDSRIFGRFVDEKTCTVIPGRGKANVRDAIMTLDSSGACGVLGVIDADFDNILQRCQSSSVNLIVLEVHDLEVLVLSSPALDKVLLEEASQPKLKRYLLTSGVGTVLDMLLTTTLPLGAIRYISARENLNLSFEGMNHYKVVGRDDLAVNLSYLITSILSRSGVSQSEVETLISKVEQLLNDDSIDALQICCGHDLTAVLCIALRKLIGSRKKGVGCQSDLEKALRMAYEFKYLAGTATYAAIRRWEDENPAYQIFPT